MGIVICAYLVYDASVGIVICAYLVVKLWVEIPFQSFPFAKLLIGNDLKTSSNNVKIIHLPPDRFAFVPCYFSLLIDARFATFQHFLMHKTGVHNVDYIFLYKMPYFHCVYQPYLGDNNLFL